LSDLSLDDLVGEYTGIVANPVGVPFLPDTLPYSVVLTIESPDWVEWGVVGHITYPADDPQYTLSAPVHVVWPIICHEWVAGPDPVGRCFSMVENFRGEGAVGYPAGQENLEADIFAYGAFTLSLQVDGSVYYMYQQGIPGPVPGILARTVEGEAPDFPNNPAIIGLGWPGTVQGSATALSDVGVYRGQARVLGKQENMARIEQLGNTFSVAYDFIALPDCGAGGEARTSFGNEDPLLQNLESFMTSSIVCIGIPEDPELYGFAGANPTGECIQVSTQIPSVLEEYSIDVMWETISVQEDGRLYWTLLSGYVAVAEAYLVLDSGDLGAGSGNLGTESSSAVGPASAAGIAAAAAILLVVVGWATRQNYHKTLQTGRLVSDSSLRTSEGGGHPVHLPERQGSGYDKLADV
jgi:hypothetical protein